MELNFMNYFTDTQKHLRWDGLKIVLTLGTLLHTPVSFIRKKKKRKISVNKEKIMLV